MLERPKFPKRAIVTAGMPYGNKSLHFGHVAGVFVPADIYARFLRDRIGKSNVLFVCGTDCYGSPINEGYRKLVENEGYEGTLKDYVTDNHKLQVKTLGSYGISLDIYEGSAIGDSGRRQEMLTRAFILRLYENGFLERRFALQFYDASAETFLNGRQVLGRCPIQGCKSEKAYADECELGHQYMPEELIAPRSALTGGLPELRPVENWYFKLSQFRDLICEHVKQMNDDGITRKLATRTIREFLGAPLIYIQEKFEKNYRSVADQLPCHEYKPAEKGKTSFTLEFRDVDARESAVKKLSCAGVKYRTGKTLVPFRITGNIAWGVPAPQLEDEDKHTVWCWPESLWAPIAFTEAALIKRHESADAWRDFWCSDDARVYQFIGQDNIYFYGVAQTALWSATQKGHQVRAQGSGSELRQSVLVPNYHILYMGKKASSSGAIVPPGADELLEYYTVEQLRAHWAALGMGLKPTSFSPKPFALTTARRLYEAAQAAFLGDPDDKNLLKARDKAAKQLDNIENAPDPVLKESALLTNIFNRIARSCFYAAQKYTGARVALGGPSNTCKTICDKTILEFEGHMYRFEIHSCMSLMDEFLRDVNKWWSRASKQATCDNASKQALDALLRDAFHYLRCATVLMHPIVPTGCELIYDHLDIAEHTDHFDGKNCVGHAAFFDWRFIFEPIDFWAEDAERDAGSMTLKELPPHFDFFKKHPRQLE